MKPIQILLVDDHPIILKGLSLMLEIAEVEINVVAAVQSGQAALQLLAQEAIDVVLLDIRMPDRNGIVTTQDIRTRFPHTKVLIFTTFNEKQLISEAIRAGAAGYLLKDSPEEEIIAAIRAVHSGNLSFSPKAASLLVDSPDSPNPPNPQGTGNDLQELLSQREREILFLLLSGRKNREIAAELFLSEHTVRNYISNIYAALGVSNRSSTFAWAYSHGLR